VVTGGGGGGASVVTGGATVADGAGLGGGGGSGLSDGRLELGSAGGGTGELLGSVGAGAWLVELVSVNATPPMATIETSAASPKISCGNRFPRDCTAGGSNLGSCNS
jgi:hypothetical protein